MVRNLRSRLSQITLMLLGLGLLSACGADDDRTAAADQSVTTTTATATTDELAAGRTTSEPSNTTAAEAPDSTATADQTATTEPATVEQPATTEPSVALTVTVLTTTTATSVAPDSSDSAPGPAEVVTEVVGGEAAAIAARVPDGQNWAPFATFAEVTLVHPSIRVERIGFHESNNDGARQFEPTAEAIGPIVLESRERDTGSRTAADIVVQPGTEIRAPVTGTVVRAGGYVLYCDHQDDFVVMEPDAHPGWEVKVLHINGVMVSAGDRVEAGVTVLAPEATVLPFDSQVDEFTGTPPWPHVHIELVDPSIPDRPSTGGGC